MLTNKRKAQLIIITTFLSGLVAGASGQYRWSTQSSVEQDSPSQKELNEIQRAVQLDVNQRIQIERIVNETHRQYEALRTEFRPQYNTARDACRLRIRALVSSEQQILYDQWIYEQDARREQRAREEAAKNAR